jgi:hypothetical protein
MDSIRAVNRFYSSLGESPYFVCERAYARSHTKYGLFKVFVIKLDSASHGQAK